MPYFLKWCKFKAVLTNIHETNLFFCDCVCAWQWATASARHCVPCQMHLTYVSLGADTLRPTATNRHTRSSKKRNTPTLICREREERREEGKQIFIFFLIFFLCQLSSYFQLSKYLFLNCALGLSAGHISDTSKSLLVAKCHRIKQQQRQRPWNKYRSVTTDEKSRAGRMEIGRSQRTSWNISQKYKAAVGNTESSMSIDRWSIKICHRRLLSYQYSLKTQKQLSKLCTRERKTEKEKTTQAVHPPLTWVTHTNIQPVILLFNKKKYTTVKPESCIRGKFFFWIVSHKTQILDKSQRRRMGDGQNRI